MHIPVNRWGEPYKSMEIDKVVHFDTGEVLAEVSRANGGLVERDMRFAQRARDVLREIPIKDLLQMVKNAADLAAACQDSWLVHTGSVDYRITQRWAHWLRDGIAPDSAPPSGLMWESKRALGGRAALLFGDRCEDAVGYSSFGERMLDGSGLDWLNLRLSLLRTKVHP